MLLLPLSLAASYESVITLTALVLHLQCTFMTFLIIQLVSRDLRAITLYQARATLS